MTRSHPALAALVGVGVALAGLVALVAVGVALTVAFNGLVAVFGVGVLAAAGGCLAYSFVRYRQGRQDEVLELLTAAVASRVPLAPAVAAYVRERPASHYFPAWIAAMVLAAAPAAYGLWEGAFVAVLVYGLLAFPFVVGLPPLYFWVVHRRYRFDARAAQLADLLDDGVPLAEALQAVPGIVSRESRLAAAVGGPAGGLAMGLRRADRERATAAWLELVPRMLYPLAIVAATTVVTAFYAVLIVPKMKRLFDDFHEPGGTPPELPWPTRGLIEVSGFAADFGFVVVPLGLLGLLAVAGLAASATVRWHLPGVRWVYRSQVRGQVLRLLGAQVEAGRPAPAALGMLATADEFPPVVRRALARAAEATDRGEPLAGALYAAGLLPAGMVPLVRSAETTGTLPWALAELGDHLGGRAVRVVRRVSVVVAPLCVMAAGLLVAFVALAMFLPLVTLLERLSQ